MKPVGQKSSHGALPVAGQVETAAASQPYSSGAPDSPIEQHALLYCRDGVVPGSKLLDVFSKRALARDGVGGLLQERFSGLHLPAFKKK